jgi:hypothetical protein
MVSEEKESRHKGGRPAKLVKRKYATGIRYTEAEYLIVKSKAKQAGLKITAYIREMSLTGKVNARMNEEERQFVRQLISMSNSLNQLAKKANQQGIRSIEFEEYRNQIDEVLQKLKR